MGLSPTVYRDLAAQITRRLTASAFTPADSTASPEILEHRRRFVPAVQTTGSNYTFLNNDVNEDTESSVVSVPLQTTGVNTPFVAWMQYQSDHLQGFRVNASHWTTQPGTWLSTPEVLANRSRVGDPILAANPYVSGFSPQTVYCATTSYDLSPINPTISGDSAITVWQNSGYGWTSQDVDFRSFSAYWILDKPSIAVSTNPATHGTVYVAYRESASAGANNALPSILVAMKNEFTAGQFQQRSRVPLPSSGSAFVNDATVMVDSETGYVWVAYLDWNTNKLWLYESCDQAATWPYGFWLQLPPLLSDLNGYSDKICAPSKCFEARSMIAARLNDRDDTIEFLFHGWTSGVSQIFGARFMMQDGWPQHFDATEARQLTFGSDAWNAAFDFDSQDNHLATWYERTAGTTQYVTKSASLASNLTSISPDYSRHRSAPQQ